MKTSSAIRVLTAAVLAMALSGGASAAQSYDNDKGRLQANNGQHTGWEKHGKQKKEKKPKTIVVAEPSMTVLLGTGLVVLGFAAWSTRRKQ
jgi:hypothetical protein